MNELQSTIDLLPKRVLARAQGPLYRQLADILREPIASGAFPVGGVGADVTGGEGGFTAPPLAGAPAPVGAGVDPDADPWVAGAAEAAALDAVEPEDPVDAAAPVSPAEPVDPGVVSVGLPALATVAADSGGTPTTLPYGSR